MIHIDTERAANALVNRRLAYVAVSCARYDVQICTNDKAQLTAGLQREVSHRSAIEATQGGPKHHHFHRDWTVTVLRTERRLFRLILCSPTSRPRSARPSGASS